MQSEDHMLEQRDNRHCNIWGGGTLHKNAMLLPNGLRVCVWRHTTISNTSVQNTSDNENKTWKKRENERNGKGNNLWNRRKICTGGWANRNVNHGKMIQCNLDLCRRLRAMLHERCANEKYVICGTNAGSKSSSISCYRTVWLQHDWHMKCDILAGKEVMLSNLSGRIGKGLLCNLILNPPLTKISSGIYINQNISEP